MFLILTSSLLMKIFPIDLYIQRNSILYLKSLVKYKLKSKDR